MAKYYITAVSYDKSHTYIKLVKIMDADQKKLDVPLSKDSVISSIKAGPHDYYTWVSGKQGAKVNYFTLDDEDFLRTDANKIKQDNLGELPEF